MMTQSLKSNCESNFILVCGDVELAREKSLIGSCLLNITFWCYEGSHLYALT